MCDHPTIGIRRECRLGIRPRSRLGWWIVRAELNQRIVADSRNRVEWLRARSRGITATDVAALSTPRSIVAAAEAKLFGTGFSGNAFTDHGRNREPVIADWMQQNHGIAASTALFRSSTDRRHLATPDGLIDDGRQVVLAEIKTTNKPWRAIPKPYLRQIWWQQYVIGAERTLLVWEEHRDFVPVASEPRCCWIERDEAEIERLLDLAARLVAELRVRSAALRAS